MAHSSTDKDQRDRFVEAARELGCEEGFNRPDDALKRVGTTPPKPLDAAPNHTRAARQVGGPGGNPRRLSRVGRSQDGFRRKADDHMGTSTG